MVSVVIRSSMLQLGTPPEMRGRVSAVNSLFLGASNELGEFESGLTAQWWGAVRAVVIGGIGSLAVTGMWSILFPSLRNADQLTPEALLNVEVEQAARRCGSYEPHRKIEKGNIAMKNLAGIGLTHTGRAASRGHVSRVRFS